EDALRAARFDVIKHTNLNFEAMLDTLNAFQRTVKPGDVSFFYYAGYTFYESDNWLLPVDFAPSADKDISSAAYSFTRLEQGLAASNPLVSMFVLDANWVAPQLLR